MKPDPSLCPPDVIDSLKRFANDGVNPGDFLLAVIANDLVEAFGRADEHSIDNMPHIVAWVYNYMPIVACKSYENANKWMSERRRVPFTVIP